VKEGSCLVCNWKDQSLIETRLDIEVSIAIRDNFPLLMYVLFR
jgi:hypothetical protein